MTTPKKKKSFHIPAHMVGYIMAGLCLIVCLVLFIRVAHLRNMVAVHITEVYVLQQRMKSIEDNYTNLRQSNMEVARSLVELAKKTHVELGNSSGALQILDQANSLGINLDDIEILQSEISEQDLVVEEDTSDTSDDVEESKESEQ